MSLLTPLKFKLTRSNMAGKPFTVSEVNEPFPSDYESEMITAARRLRCLPGLGWHLHLRIRT